MEIMISLGERHPMIPPVHEAIELIKNETGIEARPHSSGLPGTGLQATPPFQVTLPGSEDEVRKIKEALKNKGFAIIAIGP